MNFYPLLRILYPYCRLLLVACHPFSPFVALFHPFLTKALSPFATCSISSLPPDIWISSHEICPSSSLVTCHYLSLVILCLFPLGIFWTHLVFRCFSLFFTLCFPSSLFATCCISSFRHMTFAFHHMTSVSLHLWGLFTICHLSPTVTNIGQAL